ncbi:MAG: transposase [Candidatus Omnitrophota bacterium]|nr:transposase [Candidatus Omnitrophota bacterium]
MEHTKNCTNCGKTCDGKVGLQSKGLSLELAAKKIGVCTSTLVRWKKEYNGLEVNQLKRLKGLEKENVRLKRVVAEQAVDISILKDVASGNF